MVKEKRILSYILGWFIVGYIILFIGTNNVFALTLDTQDITWYYRKTSDETTLLNTIKNIDNPLHIVNGEYMNGFTTRQDYTFNKDIQYMINYKLIYRYYEGLDISFRNDTIDRLISYSWVDNDFKLLNSNVNQTKYLCEADICTREFTISQQVLTLNNTSGIRFGIYTTEAKSLGFYSPSSGSDGVYITLSNYISIENNSSSTIIEQNNQIINGQNSLQNSITNTEDSINSNIDDMESAIVDSNKETQDVIKDQFNSCRKSVNLAYNVTYSAGNKNWWTLANVNSTNIIKGKTYTVSVYLDTDKNTIAYWNNSSGVFNGKVFDVTPNNNRYYYTFTALKDATNVSVILSKSGNSDNVLITPSKLQIQEGDVATNYEEPNTEICSNRLDEQNDKLEGIQGALTDSSSPDTGALENSAGWLPSGPLDSILNLPLTMLNSLTNSLSKTCAPLNLKLPYVNKNIQIPCLSAIFAQITGVNQFWTWVGTIASVLILYNYLLNLYSWVDRVLTLRAEFDEAMGADLANWGRL